MSYLRYSPQTGLTDSEVLDIRASYNRGEATVAELAANYSVGKTTISDILAGKSWKNVPTPQQLSSLKGYEVYPDGRVFSTKAKKFLKPRATKTGLVVEVNVNGDRKSVNIGELVAKAFVNSKAKAVTYANGDSDDVHFTNILA